MTPKPKIPTASGISRLLAAAGFERAVVKMRGGRSGFEATKVYTDEGAVRVNHWFWSMSTPVERYRQELERYAEVIAAAGYSTVIQDCDLIVTAKED